MPKQDESQVKAQEVNSAIEQIKSKFGESAIMRFGEAKHLSVDVVPTGIVSIDLALGAGGLPRGRIVEIYGTEASGKTTLANHVVAQVQKQGGVAAFVDAEHALDPDYAKILGVKIDELLISQPDSGEQALDIVETLVRSNAVDVIVVDSVAALTPRAEIEGEMGDSHMALQARLMSQALRKLTAIVAKSKTIVIFINQTRMKIGVFFGNPETTTGGNALKFYSSVRIELRRAAQIKSGDQVVGNRVKMKIVKNKIAPPFKTAEFDIIYAEGGVSKSGDVLDMGTELGLVVKSGNTYSYGEVKLGVGRENAKRFLRENPKLITQLGKQIWQTVKEQKKAE
jgi:recombination protein RecA